MIYAEYLSTAEAHRWILDTDIPWDDVDPPLARQQPDLLERVRRVSDHIHKTCTVGPVTGIQGAGFLVGLRTARPAKQLQAELLEGGILAGTASDPQVLRLLPPFILEEQHVDMLIDALRDLPP